MQKNPELCARGSEGKRSVELTQAKAGRLDSSGNRLVKRNRQRGEGQGKKWEWDGLKWRCTEHLAGSGMSQAQELEGSGGFQVKGGNGRNLMEKA